jgi:hypothetical protein
VPLDRWADSVAFQKNRAVQPIHPPMSNRLMDNAIMPRNLSCFLLISTLIFISFFTFLDYSFNILPLISSITYENMAMCFQSAYYLCLSILWRCLPQNPFFFMLVNRSFSLLLFIVVAIKEYTLIPDFRNLGYNLAAITLGR